MVVRNLEAVGCFAPSEFEALDPALWPTSNVIATFLRAQDPDVAKGLDEALVAKGRAAYFAAECNACHKLEPGEADLGPNLAGYGTEDWLLRFLRDPGHELFYAEDSQMPPFADELTDEELRALVVYLRGLSD